MVTARGVARAPPKGMRAARALFRVTARRWLVGLRKAREEQVDHAASVVVGEGLDSDAQVADGEHQVVRPYVRACLTDGGGCFQQLVEHGQEAVDELGVQALGPSLV